MKKIKLKKKAKKINFILIIIIFLIITVSFVLNIISKRVGPVITNYAEKQAKKLATIVINQAINDKLIDKFESDKIFITNNNDIDFNTPFINELLKSASVNVRQYLKKLENGEVEDIGLSNNDNFDIDKKLLKDGIIYQVPTGIIFNNGILANIGPKIPVRLNMIGDITTDIKTDVKDYGINNAVVQVSISIKVNEQVILPFSYKQITVKTDIPIALKIIKGEVPSYLLGGINK